MVEKEEKYEGREEQKKEGKKERGKKVVRGVSFPFPCIIEEEEEEDPANFTCYLPAYFSLSGFTWRCYHNTNDSASVYQRAEPPLLKRIILHKRGFSQGCTK
jgi:hypothetical protein